MQLKKKIVVAVVSLATLVVPSMVFAEGHGRVHEDTINIRSGPSSDASELGQLNENDRIQVLGRVDDRWFEMVSSTGVHGYVFAEYVTIVDVEGKVDSDIALLRDYPHEKHAEVISLLDDGSKITILAKTGDWYKIKDGGDIGYVESKYIDSDMADEVKEIEVEPNEALKAEIEAEEVRKAEEEAKQAEEEAKRAEEEARRAEEEARQAEEEAEAALTLGEIIAEDALQFLGGRYVFGGNSLTSGVDCSGFTQQIMKRHGINITRTSSGQYANNGYKVSRSNLQPGDLVFYGYGGWVSHVALYIGNDTIIHANTSDTGIILDPVFDAGKPYIGAKRVI